MVHGQGELPFVKQLGFSVAPGYESLVGLQKTKVNRLTSVKIVLYKVTVLFSLYDTYNETHDTVD